MARWCLTKGAKELLLQELQKDGDPQKMVDRGTEGRLEWFTNIVGEANAHNLNALYESKLLLKNQQRGLVSFIRNIGGPKKIQRDLYSKVKRIDKVLTEKDVDQWLGSIVRKRLGVEVSEQEYKTLVDLSKQIETTRSKAKSDFTFNTEKEKRMAGAAQRQYQKYVQQLKAKAKGISFKEQKVDYLINVAKQIPSVLKSAVTTLDNSLWGRQGHKTIADPYTADIWVKNFARSFVDAKKQLLAKGKWYESGDDAVLDSVYIDIYSDPNYLNGKYAAGGYGLGVKSEEEIPSLFLEQIPLLGRLIKVSNVLFEAGTLRLRKGLADRYIKLAERNGVDTTNPSEVELLGEFVSSSTGRGKIGKLESVANEINVLAFSIKFFKSNVDFLLAPYKYIIRKIGIKKFKNKGEEFAYKQSANKTFRVIATLASILTLAKILDPDSVDEDLRSTNSGKIKIFGHWTDITGGIAPLITLAMRLVPTKHNGKLSWWYKSSSGQYTDLTAGKYGQMNAWDVLIRGLIDNKLSPIMRIAKDVWTQETFNGEKPTISNELFNSLPISIQTWDDLRKDPNSTSILGSLILDGLGLSVSTYRYKSNWETRTSKEMKQFKEQVGKEKFKKANNDYNEKYDIWFNKIQKTSRYKSLSDEDKSKLQISARLSIKTTILRKYGFRRRRTVETSEERRSKQRIRSLIP